VFNRFLPDGMVVEAAGAGRVQQDHGQHKEPESKATIMPQPERVCMALFSSLHLLSSQVIIFLLIGCKTLCYMHY
jgi:hypothetical protein